MGKGRLWTWRFAQLFCIELVLQFGLYLVRPIVANYSVELGASVTLAGFFSGLLATTALLMRPFSGRISDALSKKSLLVISSALFTVSAFGCSAFHSLLPIGLLISLQGFAFAFKSTVVVALARLVVPGDMVGRGVGWLGVAYTVSCALGPAAGSCVSNAFGYSAVFAVSALLLSVGLVLSVLFKEPQRVDVARTGEDVAGGGDAAAAGSKDGEQGVIDSVSCEVEENCPDERRCDGEHERSAGAPVRVNSEKGLARMFYLPAIPYTVVAGLLMATQGTAASFMLLIGDMRSIDGASLYFLVYSLATLGARPLAGRLSDEYGVRKVATPMLLLAMVAPLALAFSSSMVGIVIAGICMGVGQGSAYSSIQAESVRGVPAGQLGRAANTFYIGPDLGMGMGPVAAGFILQLWGITPAFVFCAVLIAVSIVVLLAFSRK